MGLLAAYFLFRPKSEIASNTQTQLLEYELKKLNKMVVVEEVYTQSQVFETSHFPESIIKEYSILKRLDHKKIVVLTKGTVQVSYDMKKMQLETNETQKKIILKSLPAPKYELFTDIEFLNLDTGLLHNVNAEELNTYKKEAGGAIEKKIDKKAVNAMAHKQLVSNLSDLFVWAKAMGWEIEDHTKISKEVNQYIENL